MQLEPNGVVGELPAGETGPPDRVLTLFKMLHRRAALILEGDNTLVRPGEIGHDDPNRLIEFARHAALLRRLCVLAEGRFENTNGRIRRWLPRSMDLDLFSDEDIQEIAMTLNSTPRKYLGFKTPIEAMLAELGKDVKISFA